MNNYLNTVTKYFSNNFTSPSRLDNILNAVAHILLLFSICFFGYVIISNTENIFRAQDDIKFFMIQFETKYLNQSGFMEFLDYLSSISNWPHPKIVGRIQCMISYYLLGEMNYTYFILSGNFFLVTVILALWKWTKVSIAQITPIALILLIPVTHINFWPVAIVSIAPNILLVMLLFYLLDKNKGIQSGLVAIPVTLSTGLGILFPILNLLQIDKINWSNIKKYGSYIIFVLLNILLFYFIVIRNKGSFESSVDTVSSFDVNSIFARVSYLANYLFRYLTFPLFGKNAGVFSMFLFIAYVLFLLKIVKNRFHYKHKYLLYISFYWILSGTIASFLRSGSSVEMFEMPPLRYHMHSLFFVALNILFIIANFIKSKKYLFVLSVLFIFLSTLNFIYFDLRKLIDKEFRVDNFFLVMSDDGRKSKTKYRLTQRAINQELYKPDFQELLPDTKTKAEMVIQQEIRFQNKKVNQTELITNIEIQLPPGEFYSEKELYLVLKDEAGKELYYQAVQSNLDKSNRKRRRMDQQKLDFYVTNSEYAKLNSSYSKLVLGTAK